MIRIIIIFLLTYCVEAIAEIESGAYINPIVGYGYVSNGTGYNTTNNTSLTLGIMSGYAFDKFFAIDGGITFIPNTYQNNLANYLLSDVSVRGSVPLSNFASAYIHLGAGFKSNFTNGKDPSQVGIFAGFGGLFNITRRVAITIEDYGIYIPGSTNNNINVLGLGISYGL
jgi:hypothetical protein